MMVSPDPQRGIYQIKLPGPLAVILILLVTLPALGACNRPPAEHRQFSYERTTDKSLQDILEDIEFALTEHNLRIVERLHLGQAIRSRGHQDFPDYEIILYCSLSFAEKMLELAPELINACPGRVTVRGRENAYIISAPLWPEPGTDPGLDHLMSGINDVVRKTVDYAALDWLDYDEN